MYISLLLLCRQKVNHLKKKKESRGILEGMLCILWLVINYKQVNKGSTIACMLLMVFMNLLKVAKRESGKAKGHIKKARVEAVHSTSKDISSDAAVLQVSINYTDITHTHTYKHYLGTVSSLNS